ncbi:hypothetical protein [Clostridium ganghwense]|uniref:Uncharacterized protein n=1 Tax=Clostridium ganghwense TaxID=312089 RepID=A0ABT4CUN0_9CLOT|nr:hypothetical protein [Clostridium ganghwense]MCY6372790.1 hypothetical protein [Clostridium ganghwense]
MRLIKFFYVLLSIIALIVAYIYFRYDLSNFYKTILRTITYSISIIVGGFIIIKPKLFSKNNKTSEYILGVVLLLVGLTKIFLGWI